MSRVLQAICKIPWAITEDSLQRIIEIASREHEIAPEALAALAAKKVADAEYLTIRGDVGVLSITGPIFRYANLLTAMSGATSLELLALDFARAVQDDSIKSILLSIDSPGGEVSGTGEFADMVYGARTIKSVHAYVSDEGASAAYWIASAAETITLAQTAMVGSIGVVATMSKPDPKNSTEIEFVSSQSPNKRPKINTEEGRAQVQAIIDTIAGVFVENVARNRGVSTETVLSDFGKGGVMVGKDAVKAGMADAVGTFESTLAAIEMRSNGSAPDGSKSTKNGRTGMSFKDRWEAFLSQMDTTEGDPAVTPPAATAPVIIPGVVPAALAPSAADGDRMAALEAENRRLRAERYQSEAVAFAERYITSMQAFPAEREAIVAAVIQAATDDATLGTVEGAASRVTMLASIYDKRPKHQLTAESLSPTLVRLLSEATGTAAGSGEKECTDDEVRKLLAMTPLGNTVLAQMDKNGSH